VVRSLLLCLPGYASPPPEPHERRMRLEIVLATPDVRQLLSELLPAKFHLGVGGSTGRYLCLGKPRQLVLCAGVGVRIVSSARLKWPLGAFDAPILLPSLQVLLRPAIAEGGDGDALAFQLEIERCEFPALPRLVVNGICQALSRELEARHTALSWPFSQSLARSPAFHIPALFAGGDVRVRNDAIVLGVSMRPAVTTDRASLTSLEGVGA